MIWESRACIVVVPTTVGTGYPGEHGPQYSATDDGLPLENRTLVPRDIRTT